MKLKLRGITHSAFFYKVISLFFTLLLFFNANYKPGTVNNGSSNQNYDVEINDVPLEVRYNEKKYFATGYESTVTVKLTSANRVLLNMESNQQTRNFRVVADLSNKKAGTYEVKLKIEGLNSGLTAEIEPETIHVTLDTRVTKTFKVTPSVDDGIFQTGYSVDEVTATPASVTLVTGEEIAKEIDHVVAVVSDKKNVSSDFVEEVSVQARDKDGQVLSAAFTPETVKVSVIVKQPSKEVALEAITSGAIPETIDHYVLSISPDTVNLFGAKAAIEAISVIQIPVDITKVDEEVTKELAIPLPDGITASQKTVKITITPVFESSTSSSSSSKANSSSSSADESEATTTTDE